MKTPAELLLDAAAIMEERGHTSGALEDEEGRVCVYGALHVALNGQSNVPSVVDIVVSRDRAASLLRQYLDARGELAANRARDGVELVQWSDNGNVVRVSAAMRAAAEEAIEELSDDERDEREYIPAMTEVVA